MPDNDERDNSVARSSAAASISLWGERAQIGIGVAAVAAPFLLSRRPGANARNVTLARNVAAVVGGTMTAGSFAPHPFSSPTDHYGRASVASGTTDTVLGAIERVGGNGRIARGIGAVAQPFARASLPLTLATSTDGRAALESLARMSRITPQEFVLNSNRMERPPE